MGRHIGRCSNVEEMEDWKNGILGNARRATVGPDLRTGGRQSSHRYRGCEGPQPSGSGTTIKPCSWNLEGIRSLGVALDDGDFVCTVISRNARYRCHSTIVPANVSARALDLEQSKPPKRRLRQASEQRYADATSYRKNVRRNGGLPDHPIK